MPVLSGSQKSISQPLAEKKLGRTSVNLTQLGFGGAPIGQLFEKVSEENALATLQAAWNRGIRYFDTAPWYGVGLSEHRLGSFLYQKDRKDFILSTKVGRVLKAPRQKIGFRPPFWLGGLPFEHLFDYSYDGIMRSFEDSLQRLRMNSVDLLVIHDLDHEYHLTEERVNFHLKQLSNSGWKALDSLRSSGEILGVGAGINDRQMIQPLLKRLDLDFLVLARDYTLLEQGTLKADLPICEQRNIGIVLGAVFCSGILVTGAVKGAKHQYADASPEILGKVIQIEEICRNHGVPMAAAALQFPLSHPCVTSVIPGMLHPQQVEQNLEYFHQAIPSSLWSDLKDQDLISKDAFTP